VCGWYVAGGRSGIGHTQQTAGRFRHRFGAAQVPNVIPAEHEHGARPGDGTVQQAVADDQVEPAERSQGHQGLRRHVRRTRGGRQQRPQGCTYANLASCVRFTNRLHT